MAPVCVVRCLSLLCLFVLFFSTRVNSLSMYNYQTLMDLPLFASNLTNATHAGHKTLSPLQSGIPAHLCRTLASVSRRKRFRSWGKRSGLLVKLKAFLVRSSWLLEMNMDLCLVTSILHGLWIPLTPGWRPLLAWIRWISHLGSSLLIFVSVG